MKQQLYNLPSPHFPATRQDDSKPTISAKARSSAISLIAFIVAACGTSASSDDDMSESPQKEFRSVQSYEELLQDPRYKEHEGLVVFEGDIVIGTIDEVKAQLTNHSFGTAVDGALGKDLAAVGGFDRSSRFDVAERTWGNKIKYIFGSTVSENTRNVIRNDVMPRFQRRTSLLFEESTNFIPTESVVSFLNTPDSTLCAYYQQTINGVLIHQVELHGCAAVQCIDGLIPGGDAAEDALCDCDCDAEAYVQVLHELGHALGLGHEHQRPDRDSYVLDPNYDPNSTDPAYKANNDPYAPSTVEMFGDYDVKSVMQYQGLTNLANNTVIPVNKELSDYDVRGIQIMYGSQYQSTASAVSWGANRLDVFYRATNGSVGHQAWGGAWVAGNLGGVILGAPEAVSHAPNRLHVFVRDTNRKLRVKEFDNSGWDTSWVHLGNETLASDPTAVSWGQNHVAIFAKHDDGSVRVKTWNGTSYSAWVNLGGYSKGPIEAVSWQSGRLDVFTVGLDGALYHKWFRDGSWFGEADGTWERLGGYIVGKPAVVSWGPNRIDIFAKGLDNGLYHKYWNGGPNWLPANQDGSWESMGGSVIGHPVVESWGSSRIDLFWQASNGELRTKVYDNGWFNSTALSESSHLVGAPEVVSWGPNRIDVFVRGTDDNLRHKAWGGGPQWSPANNTNSRGVEITW